MQVKMSCGNYHYFMLIKYQKMGYHPLYALGTSLPRSTLSGDHGRSIYTIEFGKYYKPSLSPSSSESQLLNIYEHMTGYNAQNLVPQNRLL